MRRAPFLLLAGFLAALGHCASREDKAAVTLAHNRSELRNCTFLGRVSAPESGASPELTLRMKVADAGGNTLFLLQNDLGEAWGCTDTLRAYSNITVTPTPVIGGRVPTPKPPQ